MFSPKNGIKNEANDLRIPAGALATTDHDDLFNEPAPDPGPSRAKPDNYLVQSILCLIFCCWPMAIPAIINASRVNSRWAEGDYEGAEEASEKAKQFCWISFGVGIVVGIIALILNLANA